ncbi:hypothetical protein BaRGS_00029621 [Batillaria attramentaria]|uniref:ubiquitinyl hydrolase 1 n=1 Tax=Batillaria attramentaria TaxID=370345 RepID=A0ABD0JVZ5_9CAEN
MPSGEKKRQLYLAKNMAELQKMSEVKQLTTNARILVKSADKMFHEAEKCFKAEDEERAFVMYMKYFNVVKQQYYDNLIGQKNQVRAIENAEKLADSLKERYDFREAEAVAKKFASLDTPGTKSEKTDEPEADVKKDEKTDGKSLSPMALCELLRDSNAQVILMDTRPYSDFKESHISHSACISVPQEAVPPGTTVKHIESQLPEESHDLWKQRGNVDHIVLIDWSSRLESVTIGTTLCTLKDALFKYDATVIIKSEPLVLEGGYEQWLLFYPTMTTNALVAPRPSPASASTASSIASLDFDYPDFDEKPQTDVVKSEANGTTLADSLVEFVKGDAATATTPSGSMPRFDRSLKPKGSSGELSDALAKSGSLNNARNINLARDSRSGEGISMVSNALYPSISVSRRPEKNTNIFNDLQRPSSNSDTAVAKNDVTAEEGGNQFQRPSPVASTSREEDEAKSKVMELEEKRRKEEKALADLMRKKRHMEEEIKQSERRASEERELQDARDKEREKEETERQRRAEVERLRLERKKKELEEQAEKEKQNNLVQAEDERRLAAKRVEDEKRIAAEKERAAAAQQDSLRQAQEPKMVPAPSLPSGWEKRLDSSTNRYYYIDHNRSKTQWEPPQGTIRPSQAAGTYTTRLKEEPAVSSRGGLTRSHSSPDIMKQLADEERAAAKPVYDRGAKPAARIPPADSTPTRQVVRRILRRDLNPVFGDVGPALTGLRNLGNTCYMNSTIQCLNNTTPLISYFLNDTYHEDINRNTVEGMNGEVVDDFAVVVKALWSGQYRCITPRDLKATVGKYNPMFAGYQQQDSQEFLTFLLDGLHEGLNEVKVRPQIPDQENDRLPDHEAAKIAWENHKRLHRSIIVELFQGQLKSTLMCRTCQKKSVTFQAFMYISLPIPASSRCSLRDCFRAFLQPEMMTGSCKWKCPQCRVERDAEKKIDIWKLPHILLIGLNRFVSDGMWMQKKTTYVDFPVNDLDLGEFMIGPRHRSRYNLYGVSNHYGTMEGGHYTAFCRNPCTTKWYKFDDHEVYEMSKSDVKTSAAFVLYYSSIELKAPQFKPHF